MAKVILDAGHGGADPGAVFDGRQEKDDNLRVVLAVGEILENNGVEVAYTRTEDVYDTPLQKAQIANEEGGDFFVSIHRNSSPEADQYSGVETLAYDLSPDKVALAEAINEELEEVGFRNLGVKERTDLIVLKRTQMPAVLVEVGFLNTEADNLLFDEQFTAIAEAIAGGILSTLEDMGLLEEGEYRPAPDGGNPENGSYAPSGGNPGNGSYAPGGGSPGNGNYAPGGGNPGNGSYAPGGGNSGNGSYAPGGGNPENGSNAPGGGYGNPGAAPGNGGDGGTGGSVSGAPGAGRLYRVQTGAFRKRAYAEDLLYRLERQNYPAFLLYSDGLYKVQVGAFAQLDNAIRMEEALRRAGYSTFITAE